MSTTPWRGTLIFAGGIAAIAATAVTRFAGADVAAAGAAAPAGVSGTSSTVLPAGSSASAGSAGSAAGSGKASGSAATSGSAGATSAASNPAATPSAPPAASSGTVTIVGSTVQTRYGPVQLSVTFDGSRIADVQALQSPDWHGESVQINAYAIPVLNQEAVAAGSAKIDSVSGATFTSVGYKQSLQSAIDQHG
ncbi:MAG TPA: FMN-binding protein [Cellulomonas sp.]